MAFLVQNASTSLCFSSIADASYIKVISLHATDTGTDPFFTLFKQPIASLDLPAAFASHPEQPHPLCLLAAEDLQDYLKNQQDWTHNFGLPGSEDTGAVIGKMFGILAVRNQWGKIGYLSAFSGKLAGSNHHVRFVPPVYDMLTSNSFLNIGMRELAAISQEIDLLSNTASPRDQEKIVALKANRKQYSIQLQYQLFDQYHFLNASGVSKNINQLFKDAGYKNPPSGAGECAGPKLLQYAFIHQMKPLAIAEFWWGQSPKSDQWKHKQFYPCCREKCGPILAHMLG